MNIIIVGCGKIGKSIIASLTAEGHDITVIEQDPDVLSEVTNIYDVIGICGSGVDYETLAEAGIDKAEMFVSVTGSDEMNMLSCFFAKKMGAVHTIARIRNPEYNDRSLGFMRQQLALSMSVNPERLAARELFNILRLPNAAKVESFSRGNFEMVEIRISDGSELDGLSLSRMREKYKASVLVCAVERDSQLYIPDGNFVLHKGDKIGLIASHTEVQKLLKLLGALRRQAKNIMILGGSKTAYYLAKMCCSTGMNVKIIEKNQKRCEELSILLPKAMIICGDGAQQELLLEEGITSQDAFVSLTGMDEENIIISLFASRQRVPKVISKINRSEMLTMARQMGLESIITPREITSNILVRFARALENSMGSNVETLYRLMDGKAEALEFNAGSDLTFLNKPLKELNFRKNILIGGILRGRKTIIPSGDDMILPGDRVIVLAADQRLQDLSDIINK